MEVDGLLRSCQLPSIVPDSASLDSEKVCTTREDSKIKAIVPPDAAYRTQKQELEGWSSVGRLALASIIQALFPGGLESTLVHCPGCARLSRPEDCLATL